MHISEKFSLDPNSFRAALAMTYIDLGSNFLLAFTTEAGDLISPHQTIGMKA
jgi:hypothetical protein